jgi:hypothetical protein
MIDVQIFPLVGDFGEDKDAAAALRKEIILPALAAGDEVRLDFDKVTLVTQSFVHAMISDVLRQLGEDVLDKIEFKNCAPGVQGIIETVVQYSLETIEDQ